jgi:transcription antitermination factor NusA-like protein
LIFVQVPIFRKYHAIIIGKGGANIKKIRDETNTQINVPKEDSAESDIITVIGEWLWLCGCVAVLVALCLCEKIRDETNTQINK